MKKGIPQDGRHEPVMVVVPVRYIQIRMIHSRPLQIPDHGALIRILLIIRIARIHQQILSRGTHQYGISRHHGVPVVDRRDGHGTFAPDRLSDLSRRSCRHLSRHQYT